MQFRRADWADLAYFLEVAKHRNFRGAGAELGVSASALSHALRGLEGRLGIRLLNRTSRSVTLTAAGEELQASILKPFDDIGRAVEVVNKFRDAPPMLRVPLAEGTLVATSHVPPTDLIPSFQAVSDVMGTGWFAADAANVKQGSAVVVVGDGPVSWLCSPQSKWVRSGSSQ
jgi:DNA-binding transcriptional LysR family regulator